MIAPRPGERPPPNTRHRRPTRTRQFRIVIREIEALTLKKRWRCYQCAEDWPEWIICCLNCGAVEPSDDLTIAFASPRFGVSFSGDSEARFGGAEGQVAVYAECRVGQKLGMASISVGGFWRPKDRLLRQMLGLVTRLLALEGALGHGPAGLSPEVQAIVDRALLAVYAWIKVNEPATALRLRGENK